MSAEPLDLARRLIAAGIPVVVVNPKDDVPRQAWKSITSADQCDLSLYRRGDALLMLGGHGIDVVDEDTKLGGSVDNLPPFKSYGTTRTPSGGAHYIVPSAGVSKVSPFRTDLGLVGDYAGGRPDHTGRLGVFLPGSRRAKYPDGEYVEEVPWDIEACLAATPDPDLLEALTRGGGTKERREDVYLDDSPERDPALGPHPYAAAAVEAELARLDECDMVGWDGPPWDNTCFEVACNLVEFGNSNWTGYHLDELRDEFMLRAPADEDFHARHHESKWDGAVNKVDGGGRPMPKADTAADVFDDLDPLPADEEPSPTGILAKFARLTVPALMDPNRPEREYVVKPFIAAGTSVAFVAPAGHRKSLILLALSLAVARGDAEFAGMPIPHSRRVFYVDMENTEDDLRERLASFGVTEADTLDNFILISLPSMDPLDTAKGGKDLLAALDAYGLEAGDLVVLDSYQRVTAAGENDSDTTRGYYRHTGVHLKARGYTVVRTDNTGKDVKKGARGSSGKRDDVDVEYLVESTGTITEVTVGKARQRGVERLLLAVTTDAAGLTTFRSTEPVRAPSDLQRAIDLLDELGAPLDVSQRKALELVKEALTAADKPISRDNVRLAVEVRKERAGEVGAVFADADEDGRI